MKNCIKFYGTFKKVNGSTLEDFFVDNDTKEKVEEIYGEAYFLKAESEDYLKGYSVINGREFYSVGQMLDEDEYKLYMLDISNRYSLTISGKPAGDKINALFMPYGFENGGCVEYNGASATIKEEIIEDAETIKKVIEKTNLNFEFADVENVATAKAIVTNEESLKRYFETVKEVINYGVIHHYHISQKVYIDDLVNIICPKVSKMLTEKHLIGDNEEFNITDEIDADLKSVVEEEIKKQYIVDKNYQGEKTNKKIMDDNAFELLFNIMYNAIYVSLDCEADMDVELCYQSLLFPESQQLIEEDPMLLMAYGLIEIADGNVSLAYDVLDKISKVANFVELSEQTEQKTVEEYDDYEEKQENEDEKLLLNSAYNDLTLSKFETQKTFENCYDTFRFLSERAGFSADELGVALKAWIELADEIVYNSQNGDSSEHDGEEKQEEYLM